MFREPILQVSWAAAPPDLEPEKTTLPWLPTPPGSHGISNLPAGDTIHQTSKTGGSTKKHRLEMGVIPGIMGLTWNSYFWVCVLFFFLFFFFLAVFCWSLPTMVNQSLGIIYNMFLCLYIQVILFTSYHIAQREKSPFGRHTVIYFCFFNHGSESSMNPHLVCGWSRKNFQSPKTNIENSVRS